GPSRRAVGARAPEPPAELEQQAAGGARPPTRAEQQAGGRADQSPYEPQERGDPVPRTDAFKGFVHRGWRRWGRCTTYGRRCVEERDEAAAVGVLAPSALVPRAGDTIAGIRTIKVVAKLVRKLVARIEGLDLLSGA